MAESMKPGETMTDFLDRMRERWGHKTGQPWSDTGPQVAFFLELLAEVQSGLDNIVGLDTKPWQEIQAHILHFHGKREAKDREKKEQTHRDGAKLIQHKLKKIALEEAALTASVQQAPISKGDPPQRVSPPPVLAAEAKEAGHSQTS